MKAYFYPFLFLVVVFTSPCSEETDGASEAPPERGLHLRAPPAGQSGAAHQGIRAEQRTHLRVRGKCWKRVGT